MATSAKRQISLFVNGAQVEASVKNITSAFKQASNELANMVVGSDEYVEKLEEVRRLDAMLKQHRDAVRGVEQGWNLASTGMGNFIGIAAGAFTVDAVLDYGKELFNTASNLELMEKKARTVFGEALPQVTAAAEENASAMGLTNAEYVAGAAAIQDLLVPMGFQRKEAANVSTQLIDLSGALAEWSDGQHDAKEVSDILATSLLGERDALNSLGIDIKQAEVDAELYARGLDKLTGASAKQAEATVTLDLILQKSTDAQAAFADGAGSIARRSAEMSAKFSEITEKLAKTLIPVFEQLLAIAGPIVDVFADIVEGIGDLINPAEAASEAFDEQAKKVSALEKDISPLLDRYDVLTSKTTLTTDEQNELRAIIDQVSASVPGAVTEFDKYGRALSLNTAAAREFIAVEQERLKATNATAIAENEKKLATLKREQQEILAELNRGGKTIVTRGNAFGEGPKAISVSLTPEEQLQRQQRLQELEHLDKTNVKRGLIVGFEAELARLRGDNLAKVGQEAETVENAAAAKEDALKKEAERQKQIEAAQEARERASQDAEKESDRKKREQEKTEEDLAAHLKRIQEIVETNEQEARLRTLTSDEQEIERIRLKYEKEIELVTNKFEGQAEVQAAVDELKKQRDEEIAEKEAEQREAAVDAEIEAYIEDQERIAEAKQEYEEGKAEAETEIKEFQAEALFSERELELQALTDHYANLLKIAEQYGIDTTTLKEAFAKKQAEVEKKYADKSAKDQAESLRARLSAMQSAFTAFGDLTMAVYDLLGEQSAEAAAVQKVFTLAKIAFDTAAAISSLVAAANANPANSTTFGAAGAAQFIAGLAQIIANIAQAKQVLSGAPKVQAKAEGGYLTRSGSPVQNTFDKNTMFEFDREKYFSAVRTDSRQIQHDKRFEVRNNKSSPTGGGQSSLAQNANTDFQGDYITVTGDADNRQYSARTITAPPTGMLPGYPVVFTSTATDAPVLASERGAEYFVASHDLANPYVANLVRMIDNITHTGRGVPQFAEGGINTADGSAVPTAPTPSATTIPPELFTLIADLGQAVNTLNAILSSGKVIAVVPDRTITDIQKRFKQINDASGGFFS